MKVRGQYRRVFGAEKRAETCSGHIKALNHLKELERISGCNFEDLAISRVISILDNIRGIRLNLGKR